MNHTAKSNFTDNLLSLNHLNDFGFKTWLIKPGTVFADPDKWWIDQESRPALHEGLDLTIFIDNKNNERRLTENTTVPPLYRGQLVNIIDDFLGKTVIVDHGIINRKGSRLHGLYAHILPTTKLEIGAVINEDEGVGTIAKGNHICPAHLHISTVWISREFPVERLSWTDFAKSKGFYPCNPLDFI